MRWLMCVALACPVLAEDLGRVALVQALKDAACGVRLMCVAAHPDDEDGASLAYYRMKHGVKTFVVIATRGEGGQNEIGPELYNDLGVIRTREMINAARVEGSELHFLDFPEFGFSKSLEEAMEAWDPSAARERVRKLLRDLRPDVVITHHGLMKDHGQHQAIGQLIKEAVEAEAGTVQRLYVRKFEGGDSPYTMDLGELEPVRGLTYAQIAAQALEEHHSQGMKFFIDRYLTGRPQAVYFERVVNPREAGEALGGEFGPLFSGIKAVKRPQALVDLARAAQEGLSNAKVLDALAALPAEARAAAPEDLARAAAIAAELRLKATPEDSELVASQLVTVAVELTDFGAQDIDEATFSIEAFGKEPAGGFALADTIESGETLPLASGIVSTKLGFEVPRDAPLTLPHAEHLFSGNVLFTPQVRVRATGTLRNGAPFTLEQAVYVDVAPVATLEFTSGPYFMNPERNDREARAQLTVRNHTPGALQSSIKLTVPAGWHASPVEVPWKLEEPGEQRTFNVSITAVESFEGRKSIEALTAGHTASVEVVSARVKLDPGARVGLVRSYDDTLEATLRKLGVQHGLVGPQDFSPAALARYTTLLIDMRAYQYRPDLVANNEAVLDFARAGGNVIIMYQKTFDWRPAFAPIPFQIANNRTTREDAPVKLLVPEHPYFNTPNTLLPSDWDGWIQERGLYFAGQWPAEYTPLLETSDPGETVPAGALITAPLGKGQYTYCALALYRQLRALHPGALRLFANMIATPAA